MKINKDLQKDVQNINRRQLLSALKTDDSTKYFKHLKMFICITGFAGIGLFLNSCMSGYVGSEPVYIEYARPAQPGNLYIWIAGDWGWNNQSNVYVRKPGNWEKPRQGQTYVSGHWQSTTKGKYWSNGYWQSQNSNRNHHKR